MPPGFGGRPLPTGIPPHVNRAFIVWLAVVALGLLTNIVSAFSESGGGAASTIVLSIIFGAIGLFLVAHFRGGANWARITLTVLTGIALFGYLFVLLGSFVLLAILPVLGIVLILLSVVEIGLGVFALINAWNGNANAYFTAMSR